MKNIFAVLVLVLGLASCKTSSNLPAEEAAKFSTKGFEVLYEGKPVAKYVNREYEYSKGEFQFEFSIVQYEGTNLEMTKKIAMFLAEKHPDAKIEIKLQNDVEGGDSY